MPTPFLPAAHAAERYGEPCKLLGLPCELLDKITGHLALADLARLRAVHPSLDAYVSQRHLTAQAAPAGFAAPCNEPTTLLPYLARRRDAAKNMAQGRPLQQHASLPTLTTSAARIAAFTRGHPEHQPLLSVTEQGAVLLLDLLKPEGAQMLLPPEAPLAAGVQERRQCLSAVPLSDQPGHWALLMARANQAPQLYHVQRGREPAAYTLAAADLNSVCLQDRIFNRIGANGDSATTSSSAYDHVHFWRRQQGAFHLIHSEAIVSRTWRGLPYSNHLAVCPTTGRVAIAAAGTLTIRDPAARSVATAPLLGLDEAARLITLFSPDGRWLHVQVILPQHNTAPSAGCAMHFFGVQAHGDGGLTLQALGHLPPARRSWAWHRATGGAWRLRISELAHFGAARVWHWAGTAHPARNAAFESTAAGRATRAAYAHARSGRPHIDILGDDADGNLHHIVAEFFWDTPFVYRIAADSGTITRRPLAHSLAFYLRGLNGWRKIDGEQVPKAQARWSTDGTALQLWQLGDDGRVALRLIDFTRADAPGPLGQRLRDAARTTWADMKAQRGFVYKASMSPVLLGANAVASVCALIVVIAHWIAIGTMNPVLAFKFLKLMVVLCWELVRLAVVNLPLLLPYVAAWAGVVACLFGAAVCVGAWRPPLSDEHISCPPHLEAMGLQALA